MAEDIVDLTNNSLNDDGVDLDRSVQDDFIKLGGARKFSYDDLVSATNNFSEKEQLGEGGFGSVYRGFLKELNCYVAVKRLSRDSKQGNKEFASEVKIISQLRHKNIVQLMGWCHERKELLLVYEFMANGSLDSHLFKENRFLTWEVRYNIARGLASGLLYLHEEGKQYVVHRDIKASNIMLDSKFNAKIGDFGLARLGDHGKGLDNTTMAGTIGYVSPEYATSGRASKESDVYSFGVVLLEIACGRKVINLKAVREDQINLREWVWDLYGRRNILEAIDPRLNGEFDTQQAECVMIVGLWCAHPDAHLRPIVEKAVHVLNFVAPLPHLPSKMPFATYFAWSSMSSRGTDLFGSRKEKLAAGGFGSLYKGILRELKSPIFGIWKRSKAKKEDILSEAPLPPLPPIRHPFDGASPQSHSLTSTTTEFSGDITDSQWNSESEKPKDFGSGVQEAQKDKLFVFEGNFTLEDLLTASAEVLGKGSYVTAYKVSMEDRSSMEGRTLFVVKRLGWKVMVGRKEFEQQMEVIGRMGQHSNVVPLRAHYYSKDERFLVYDYMRGGSFSALLHGDRGAERTALDWDARLKICLGAAKGIAHIHSAKCVHGNIKASKILLTSDLDGCISDVGLTHLMNFDSTISKSNGYTAPELIETRKVNQKSDVYSFGIVLLEMLTGKAPRQDDGIFDIPRWVMSVVGEEWTSEVFDVELMRYQNVEDEMVQMLQIAMNCVATGQDMRPTMTEVVRMME